MSAVARMACSGSVAELAARISRSQAGRSLHSDFRAYTSLVNRVSDKARDPTKEPEFQKVIRHFVTTPPKPHSEMKVGKREAKLSAKANWPKKARCQIDGVLVGRIVGDFILAA